MTTLLPAVPIAPRYTRSVQLPHDAAPARLADALAGYQLTPLGLHTLTRIVAGVQPASTTRAFSIIGSYGAGKSAFVLFLSQWLALPDSAARTSMLSQHAATNVLGVPDLPAPRLCPVLVGGDHRSLRHALRDALHTTLAQHPDTAAVRSALAAATPQDESPQRIADLFQQAAQVLAAHTAWDGLAVVIDELGQYLDYAAQQQHEADLFVLQTLAEMAARSGDAPCLIVTVLHQAFDRYARTANATQRTEWAKVQGRFTDLPFQEPLSDVVRMIAAALVPASAADPYAVQRQAWVSQHAPLTTALGLVPRDMQSTEWQTILAQTYPLHPLVLLALPRVFRHLAQNERSLFAFLASHEPYSLPDLVAQAADAAQLPIYRLAHLFAYIEATLGAALFTHARGRRWAELAEARLRVMGDEPTVLDTLTTIGMLNALGQSHDLRASAGHISYALCDTTASEPARAALETLSHRQQIIYRRFSDSYVLWEGSDLDLDTLVGTARQSLPSHQPLSSLLHRATQLAPLIAHRHSYRTGSVRHFVVQFVTTDQLPQLPAPPPHAAGQVLYLVPDPADGQQRQAWLTDPARQREPQQIVVVPQQLHTLHTLLLDVAALQQVLDEQPALAQDAAARRELGSQLAEAQHLLDATLARAYHPAQSTWWWCGEVQPVATMRQRDDLLSRVCDHVFAASPHIWNELIMRQQLPSASAKARRMLIAAMLEQGHLPELGLTGYPPERSIYASVLLQSGIHREHANGVWGFGPPPPHDPARLAPVWAAIQTFLGQAIGTVQPLSALYTTLQCPPYGIKAGLVPILFVAAYLEQAGEIALYERDAYVTVPDLAFFERMLRQPEQIGVRVSRVAGVRHAVYERLAQVLAPHALARSVQPALLDAVTPLLKFAHQLPPYTRTTQTLSAQAQAVRHALLTARAPDELLFGTLPQACGIATFADHATDPDLVEQFFVQLKTSLMEVQDAYPRLREQVLNQIRQAFQSPASDPTLLRTDLLTRYRQLANQTSDTQLRAFGVRLEHAEAYPAWVESVAALIGRKPLEAWHDHEVQAHLHLLADLGRRFRMVEQLAIVAGDAAPAAVVRVGIFDETGEQSRVLRTTPPTPRMQQAKQDLQIQLERYGDLTADQHMGILTEILRSLLAQQRSADDG